MIALAIAACGGTAAMPEPVSNPGQPPEPNRNLNLPPQLAGLCDASGAVEVAGRWLVVADDEVDHLLVFDRDLRPAAPIELAPLAPALAGAGESDLEGMTTGPDGIVYVIGSHDPGSGTEPRPDRSVLFGLRLTASDDGVTASLAGPVDTSRKVVALVESGTEGRTAKDTQGLSIEGLGWRDGALTVGFRAPVRAGRAAIVTHRAGGADTDRVEWLELGGRGIRSLEEDLVVAGGDLGFALFRLQDGVPVQLPVDFGDLNPEALVHRTDGWWVISDDGRREIGGRECKKLPEAMRRARLQRLDLPPAGPLR